MKAVLLDALGTLVRFAPPAPLLVAELGERGVAVSEDEAGRALAAEIAYYREHHDDASDRAGLADLRARCTEVLRAALPDHARAADDLQGALLGSLRFEPYAEVPDTLRALRDRGARLVVVSNWDVSLHDVLAQTGLDALVDRVLTSAEEGVAKPDPLIFARALDGIAPGDALHVGDSLEADVAGARAAGVTPVFVAREGERSPPGVLTIPSLAGSLDLYPG